VVYVAGGTTAAGNTRAVWALDTRGGTWSALAPLPAARFNHDAVALGGRVYVLGGLADGGRERRDVFVYDPRADRWSSVTPLPGPAHAFAAVAFRGELWVLGGRAGEHVSSDVWVLEPASGRWRAGPALPEPMELLGAAAAGDEVHAVRESTYLIYDAGSGDWRSGARPLVTRHALEAFAINGVLYTIGGCTTALRDTAVVERRPILPG
jgi:N-acetylneuraminic acid mutarotase